jgi:hypothetical protein
VWINPSLVFGGSLKGSIENEVSDCHLLNRVLNEHRIDRIQGYRQEYCGKPAPPAEKFVDTDDLLEERRGAIRAL